MGMEELRQVFRFPKDAPSVPASDHGWFGPEHVELLTGCLTPKIKVALELGSWLGKSTRFIADHAPNATVLAVDHWRGSQEHLVPGLSQMLPTLYETFLKSCWEYRDRIVPIRMGTVEAMKIVHQHGIVPDVIYIDASHEYPDAMHDIHHALMLFPSALLAGDDFMWPGVARGIRELRTQFPFEVWVKGNVWWKKGPEFSNIVGGGPI